MIDPSKGGKEGDEHDGTTGVCSGLGRDGMGRVIDGRKKVFTMMG